VGVVAGARITGLPATYLLRWWWVLGMLLWCAIAWSAWKLLVATKLARVVALVAVGALAAFSVGGSIAAATTDVPLQHISTALNRMMPSVTAPLAHDRTYLVTYANFSELGAAGDGLYLALAERGFHVKVRPESGPRFGPWRVAHAGDLNGTITLADSDDLAGGWTPPPAAREVAHYDPLTPARRSRAASLAQQLHAEVGDRWWIEPDTPLSRALLIKHGANPSEVRELHHLRGAGPAYTVYLN
jgi:hypothetical protein